MSRATPSSTAAKEPFDFVARLREISMFFDGTSKVHDTMRRVAGKLEAAGIPYAIVGGMAVNAHKHERTTKDVDFLLTSAGIAPSADCTLAASSIQFRAVRGGSSIARTA